MRIAPPVHPLRILFGVIVSWSGCGFFSLHSPPPSPTEYRMDAFALGSWHACRSVSGNVDCWGDNRRGQLGTGDLADRAERPRIAVPFFVHSLSAGRFHTCAAGRRSTEVACWGRNTEGQSGKSAKFAEVLRPANVTGLPNANLRWLAVGAYSSCVALGGSPEKAELWCWGDAARGPTPKKLPSLPQDSAWDQVAFLDQSTCVRNLRGEVSCGEHPNLEEALLRTPKKIETAEWIAGGGSTFCMIRRGAIRLRTMHCRKFTEDLPDVSVPAGTITAFSVADGHACLTLSGRVYCRGANGKLQAAPTAPSPAILPNFTEVPFLNGIMGVSVSEVGSCAFPVGHYTCWGAMTNGVSAFRAQLPPLTPALLKDAR